MPTIKLNLEKDIYVNDNNQVTIKKSNKEGNALELRSNGLYVDGSKGEDGESTGSGYRDQSYKCVRIGYKSMYGSELVNDHRVLLTNIVHRTFHSNNGSGTDLQNFRNEIDHVLPGDIFIYNDKPYIVTTVTGTGYDGSELGAGNTISSFAPLINEWEVLIWSL